MPTNRDALAAVDWAVYAREVVEHAVRCTPTPSLPELPQPATEHGGVFVTLKKHHRLRGCVGSLESDLPLADAVQRAATSAALRDPRFEPMTLAELPEIAITVSILSEPRPMQSLDELELGRHGVIVRRDGRHGLFLPQVAIDHKLDKQAFVSRCCTEKAQLAPDAWLDPKTEILLFTSTIFEEAPQGSAS